MKFRISILLIISTVLSCQQSSTDFNPFDNDFRLHSKMDFASYDTVLVQCGFWNLTMRSDNLSTYYQFFTDETPVVAKGFDFLINDLKVDTIQNDTQYDSLDNILKLISIDTSLIKQQLMVLGIKDIVILNDSSNFRNVKLIDNGNNVHFGDLFTFYDESESKLIRSIHYFNGRKD